MFLSRVKLDYRKNATMIALNNPQKFHGAIEDSIVNKRERNLWRIDELSTGVWLIILSQEKPNLISIDKQFGFGDKSFETKPYDALLERITDGSIWHFKLVANPTISVNQDGSRGKVQAHISQKYQQEWLVHKANLNGFIVDENQFMITSKQWIHFCKEHNPKAKVSLLSVTFEGMLTVTDTELFIKALTNGVGRGKAYGMGMLTVVRNES